MREKDSDFGFPQAPNVGLRGMPSPFKVQQEVAMPPEAESVFAVSLHLSEKHGVIFMLTNSGYMFMFDIASATMLVRTRVSTETIIVGTTNPTTGGALFVNKKGCVMSVSVNESVIISHVMNDLNHLPNRVDVAFALARRFGLPGAGELFQHQFSTSFASGDYKIAAQVVGQCKSGLLRTQGTIAQFKGVQVAPGQPSPLIAYFSTLMEYGKLNALESLELIRLVVANGRRDLVEKWLREDKLECNEELGDIVQPLDAKCALSIYVRAGAHQKVIACFVAQGQYEQVLRYVKKFQYQADYLALLTHTIAASPEGATKFAAALLEGEDGQPLVDLNQVVKVFTEKNLIEQTTQILLGALKEDLPEQGHLQTQLLVMNLQHAPKVAEDILQMQPPRFTHYDRAKVAQLRECSGLMQDCPAHYIDIACARTSAWSTGTRTHGHANRAPHKRVCLARICPYPHAPAHQHTRTPARARTHAYTHTHTHAQYNRHTHTQAHPPMHPCSYNTRACTSTHAHTQMPTCMHAHMQSLSFNV